MPPLLILVILLGLNVFFVLMEYALVRVRPSRIELLARKGDARAARVQEMLGRIDIYLAAIQLGITVIGLALGAYVEPPITAALRGGTERLLGGLPLGLLRVASLAAGLGALAYAQIVIGELLPRAVALRRAEALALWGALPLRVFALVCRPAVWLMAASSRALLPLLRLRPAGEPEGAISEEELRLLLSDTQEVGSLPFERLMLHENLFDLSQAKARDAMTPRDRVAFLSLARPWAENLETIRARRFSRYPLCRASLDDAIGYVHLKDLVLQAQGQAPELERLKRELVSVKEDAPLERLLKTFPDKGTHMALVRDEKGAVTGLVTLEDLLEELVGEVADEFDLQQSWSLAEIVVPGAIALGLDAADAETAARLMVDRLTAAEPAIDRAEALAAVLERERRFSSAVGRGVAIPHARLANVKRSYVGVGRLAKPARFAGGPDNAPVRLLFLILTPKSMPVAQLKILSRIAALASNESVRRRMLRAKTPESLLEIIRTADTMLAT